MKNILTLLSLIGCFALTVSAADLRLDGLWRFQLDPKDEGVGARLWEKQLNDSLQLPGTTALAGKGEPLSISINLERPAMQSLHQRFRYVGPAWYQRTVKVPAAWQNQDVVLTLERVIWESRVWVNGQEVGAPQLSLTTPHRYDVTHWLKPGAENTITIRIDNREKVPIGVLGHSYTDETQTIWNGIVGRIALDATPKLRVERLKLRPELQRNGVQVTATFVNHSGQTRISPLLLTTSAGGNGLTQDVEIPVGESSQTFFVSLPPNTSRWSEFTPVLHTFTARLGAGAATSTITASFGLREFKAAGRGFTINGQLTFLRGTVQCAEFPQTGHPDLTGKQWEKIFTTAKAYGLNHLRFHSWCPPEIAFQKADEHGFYLQVELPNWTFKMGTNPPIDAWLTAEGERMLREYGNHPSWVMLSMGNELTGDYDKMDAMIAHFRRLEPKLMFTSTTYSFSPRGELPGPNDDYFISQQTKSGWVRGQGFLNHAKPNTTSDYAEGAACIAVPLVTHEVGQYVVYPNLAELPKYDATPLRATAWEAIKADLQKKQRLAEAGRYTRESGKLAVLLYKEDLERVLRTKDLAGIQLLQLQDFPGQGTATVGLLDAFWDSKGLIKPEEFRRFCSPTVPLLRMPKMVFQNDETFEATAELAHFGAAPLTNATVRWRICDRKNVVGEGQWKLPFLPLGNAISLGRIAQSLATVSRPAKLEVSVEIAGSSIRNAWAIWVYPANPVASAGDMKIFTSANDQCIAALRAGERVLLLPDKRAARTPIDGRFIPVFWSPLHFPNQPGTLGAMIDPAHPVWHEFPTDTHTDWQWWELTSKSFALDLDALSVRPEMPFRFVDKYNRNALPAAIFEATVGTGRLLVCTLDITRDLENRVAARQLRQSVLSYMASKAFRPKTALSETELKGLFVSDTTSAKRCKVTASSSHENYPAELAVDGKAETFWHSDWMTGAALPTTFTMELPEVALVRGFRYSPRADMNRGRIASYATHVSLDGKKWLPWGTQGQFPDNAQQQTIYFPQPVRAKFFQLTATSDHGGAKQAAIAEIELIADELSTDVRDLGIVPGFNDAK